jgi:hypothetical protein
LRKRMIALHSEGGGVKVNGLRKRTAVALSEAGVEVNGLRKLEAMVARRFLGRQQSERERGNKNLLCVVRGSVGPDMSQR